MTVILRRLFLAAIIAPLVLAAVDVGITLRIRWNIGAKFAYSSEYAENGYRDGLQMEKIDHETLKGTVVSLDSGGRFYKSKTVSLPITIVYYRKQADGYVPALSLEAGTIVRWLEDSTQDHSFYNELDYGIMTFPTYEKGWRYAKPFKIAGDEENSDMGYYYVKLSDIYTVMQKITDENEIFDLFDKTWRLNKTNNIIMPHANDIAEAEIKTIDHVFYYRGIYMSKDFHGSLWTYRDTALVAVSALFFVAAMELRYR